MTGEEYIQKLIGLSEKKLAGLAEILRLTERQSAVITEDSTEELQRIIDEKQHHMDQIDEMDDAFSVYFSRLKSGLGVQNLEELGTTRLTGAADLKRIIAEIFEMIKRIQVIERENNNKVKAVIEKLSNDIRQVNQSKMVNNGYNLGAKLPPQSYYIDQKK